MGDGVVDAASHGHLVLHVEGDDLDGHARVIARGPQVAVVDQDRRVRLKPVKIGRNYGQTVEVLEGVGPNDRLVQNPPDSLAENDQVEFAPDAPAAQNTAAAGGNRPAP